MEPGPFGEIRGIEGIRILKGFLSLTTSHTAAAVYHAALTALDVQLFRLRPIREILARIVLPNTPEWTVSPPIIHSLSEYQQIVDDIPLEHPVLKED